jgi:mannan endo-1,4-beta-mannosidase
MNMERSRRWTSPTRRDVLRGLSVATGAFAVQACAAPGRPAPATAGSPPSAPGHLTLPGALEVRGPRFFRDGQPFYVNGMNYWSALPLSRDGNAAGWDEVRRDLDRLQSLGINTLRIAGASEGPDSEPLRIVPSLQPAAGKYDPAGVAGLLRLADELKQRRLVAILMMNNFWHWSGGMAQYLAWAGAGPIPYPPPAPDGSWETFQRTTSQFYSNDQARQLFAGYLRYIVPQLSSNPSVIWELANEPRGIFNVSHFHAWIDETAGLIRSLSPGQLITTGSEGQTDSPRLAGMDVVSDHQSPHIDFATAHLWPENWGWVNDADMARNFPKVLDRATKYVNDHARRAAQLGKPMILEETGFPRDGGSFDPSAPTTFRDRYFQAMYGLVSSLKASTPMAGIMPWAWAGDARAPRPGAFWKPGDPFIGDPPHEKQGWYSIYGTDTTVEVIKSAAAPLLA